MQIYSLNQTDLFNQAANNLNVEDAWTFIRCEIMDLPAFAVGSDDFTIKIDEQAQGFPKSTIFQLAGGDNDPIENINPQTLPVAIKGDHAIWFDDNLNVAEEELEDYEYVLCSDGKAGTAPKYLIWGKLNVSKTDFYTPQSEAKKAHYFRMDDDVSNF